MNNRFLNQDVINLIIIGAFTILLLVPVLN